jgi:hypothetical protein
MKKLFFLMSSFTILFCGYFYFIYYLFIQFPRLSSQFLVRYSLDLSFFYVLVYNFYWGFLDHPHVILLKACPQDWVHYYDHHYH